MPNYRWFLIFLYVGRYPYECLVDEKVTLTPCHCPWMNPAKLDGAGHFRRFWQIVLPLVRPMVAVQALWAFMGSFETISSQFLASSVKKNTLQLPRSTNLRQQCEEFEDRLLSGCYPHRSSNLYTLLLLAKNFVSGSLTRWRHVTYPRHPFHF